MSQLIPLVSIFDLAEGEVAAGSVMGEDILLCCVEGQYYAVANRCSHASQRLSTGRLVGHEIRCPLHGASFDVRTGACTGAPAQHPIKTFPVRLEGGKVCVSIL